MKKKTLLFMFIATGLAGCIGPHVRSAKPDVPFDYNIRWIAAGNEFTVDDVEITVIDSRLNLFNSKSLVGIAIRGKTAGSNGWEPYVDFVHIAEVLGENNSADIVLTPYFKVKKNKRYQGEQVEFQIRQELHLFSMNWGTNTYNFKCGDISKKIELHQIK